MDLDFFFFISLLYVSVSFSEMPFWPVIAPVFEMLYTAQTAEPAIDHDGHSSAESFALLHAAKFTGRNQDKLSRVSYK